MTIDTFINPKSFLNCDSDSFFYCSSLLFYHFILFLAHTCTYPHLIQQSILFFAFSPSNWSNFNIYSEPIRLLNGLHFETPYPSLTQKLAKINFITQSPIKQYGSGRIGPPESRKINTYMNPILKSSAHLNFNANVFVIW